MKNKKCSKWILLIAAAACVAAVIILFLVWKGWEKQNMMKEFLLKKTPEAGYFKNDLGITDIGDPFVLKVSDGNYYMYCTSAPNGFYCWKSEDIIQWTEKKMCYVKPQASWNVDCFWAPEVVEFEGKYYMYYTAKNKNDSLRIGLAISNTPDGPFVDYDNKPLFDFGYAVIDANVFIDEDGEKFLYYSRDCSENEEYGLRKSEIYGVRLSEDMLSVEGEAVLLLTPEQKWELASGDTRWNEGPEMIKNGDTYYMSYSANFFASPSYSLGYATSKSPLGPFEKAEENPILTSGTRKDVSGTGHQSFTVSPDGTELWVVYHSHTDLVNPGGNRKVNIDRAGFTKEGRLYVNGPSTGIQPAPSGAGITNITNRFAARAGKTDAALLVDGFFSVYKKHGDMNLELKAAEGKILIELEADEEVKVSGIAIYAGPDGFGEIKSMRIQGEERFASQNYEIKEDEASPLILSFEAMQIKNMIIEIELKDGAKEIKLSEIMILQ